MRHHWVLSQLLALYLSNLVQLLKHQGPKLQLEHDFAVFTVILYLEGWEALDMFGGNHYFVRSAESVLQGTSSMKDASKTTNEQLDLAHVSTSDAAFFATHAHAQTRKHVSNSVLS